MKKLKTWYWIATIIFALMMIMDGVGGITQQEAGKEVLKHLGYPMYLLIIVGIAKLLGAASILQNKFKVIKEWAYAGFAINFIGAFASRAFVGDGISLLIPPLIALLIMFIPYILWKKLASNVKIS
ncbi:DoxX family protein [Pedobacter sp. ISL-68]|uniref:DoxX family protein n=1 Tax=unclassified Pedobacter TaxID=2628915 RepID=UPI001BE833A7|nr:MULTISPECIES: DoxX family protein [unclassified Pedobacter]MBT2563652.1 DoxX family protein [Pedobacter sp. ISL-64]MBT2589544.1 DoxX family protein [Pedobacter sp. ISL-68]